MSRRRVILSEGEHEFAKANSEVFSKLNTGITPAAQEHWDRAFKAFPFGEGAAVHYLWDGGG